MAAFGSAFFSGAAGVAGVAGAALVSDFAGGGAGWADQLGAASTATTKSTMVQVSIGRRMACPSQCGKRL